DVAVDGERPDVHVAREREGGVTRTGRVRPDRATAHGREIVRVAPGRGRGALLRAGDVLAALERLHVHGQRRRDVLADRGRLSTGAGGCRRDERRDVGLAPDEQVDLSRGVATEARTRTQDLRDRLTGWDHLAARTRDDLVDVGPGDRGAAALDTGVPATGRRGGGRVAAARRERRNDGPPGRPGLLRSGCGPVRHTTAETGAGTLAAEEGARGARARQTAVPELAGGSDRV